MNYFRYTLLTDGISDRCLMRIITWLLTAIPDIATRGFIANMADFRLIPNPPKLLNERIVRAIQQYPCDIIFVHRDAENQPHEDRIQQIHMAAIGVTTKYVPIVPVRMTEAWLLLEESAIRKAADNPNGVIPLNLPGIATLERLPDPKKVLFDLLIKAAEKSGRRQDQFKRDLPQRRQRVAELIRDFSPLNQLPAFQVFKNDLINAVGAWTAIATDPSS